MFIFDDKDFIKQSDSTNFIDADSIVLNNEDNLEIINETTNTSLINFIKTAQTDNNTNEKKNK